MQISRFPSSTFRLAFEPREEKRRTKEKETAY